MHLKRKIEQRFIEWHQAPKRLPLLVTGLRQCGKTYSALSFANSHYKSVVHLDLIEHHEYRKLLDGDLSAERLAFRLSTLIDQPVKLIPGQTVIILDGIEVLPQGIHTLTAFKHDGRFDVIAISARLDHQVTAVSTDPYSHQDIVTLRMTPLDFEEFLWAKHLSDEVICCLRHCLATETLVPDALHHKMTALLREYTVVGGMPTVVTDFLLHHNVSTVRDKQQALLALFRTDLSQHASKPNAQSMVECFDAIPKQLAKANKKFQYVLVKPGGRSSQYRDALRRLQEADLVTLCHNVTQSKMPLEHVAKPAVFKVYLTDIGLLMGTLPKATAASVLLGELACDDSAIFESLAVDIMSKMARPFFYFQKHSGLSIDFLITYRGQVVPLEVTPRTGNAKSLRTILQNFDQYHIKSAIRVGHDNLSRHDQILTLPFYLLFLLTDI